MPLTRTLARAAAIVAALGAVALPAMAQAPAAKPKPVCLMTNNIMRTSIQDDQHILFYMNNGEVWQNTLVDRCPGLRLTNGFTYEPTTPAYQICDNLVSIRTHDPTLICLLGAFKPFTPAPPAK